MVLVFGARHAGLRGTAIRWARAPDGHSRRRSSRRRRVDSISPGRTGRKRTGRKRNSRPASRRQRDACSIMWDRFRPRAAAGITPALHCCWAAGRPTARWAPHLEPPQLWRCRPRDMRTSILYNFSWGISVLQSSASLICLRPPPAISPPLASSPPPLPPLSPPQPLHSVGTAPATAGDVSIYAVTPWFDLISVGRDAPYQSGMGPHE